MPADPACRLRKKQVIKGGPDTFRDKSQNHFQNRSLAVHLTISSSDTSERVNYYHLLNIHRDASQEEINRSWRALVLRHHPDKQGSRVSAGHVDIRLVNEARWVLGDPARRKAWEEAFFSGAGQIPLPETGPHIYHHISLEEFTPHYKSETPVRGAANEAKLDDVEDPVWYSHPCRCSGEFVITHEDLEDGVEVVGCEGCGEWVRVGYEVVQNEETECTANDKDG